MQVDVNELKCFYSLKFLELFKKHETVQIGI